MDEVFLRNVGEDSFSVKKKVVDVNFDILVTLFKIFICDDEHNASFGLMLSMWLRVRLRQRFCVYPFKVSMM